MKRRPCSHAEHMHRSRPRVDTPSDASVLPWRTPGILVGVDGSEGAAEALAYAVGLAPLLGMPLHTVYVWDYPPVAYQDPTYPAEFAAPLSEAEHALSMAREKVFGAEVPDWYTESRVRGYPSAILTALSTKARMLVLGSRGLGGFAGLLLGSVSATCAAHASCPVLVIPPQARRPRVVRPSSRPRSAKPPS